MMGIISDIHGNYEALKMVLSELDKEGINDIYCLGDVVGYYSEINQCCEELRKRNVKCVLGNHDWYMIADSFCPRSKSVNDCLRFQRRVITRDNYEWLRTFSVMIKKEGFSMVHGGWSDPIDEYLEPCNEYFEKLPVGFYFSGHTHIQQIHHFGDRIYCNPGSVGQPRDGNPKAAYAIWDGNEIQLKRVSYDIAKVQNLMKDNGFEGYYYECLEIGARNLGYIHKNR